MTQILRRLGSHRQRGQIIIMVALSVMVMFAVTGLAVDVGRLYVARAELSRAVDSAALSGVLELPDQDAACDKANGYFLENEPEGQPDCDATEENKLTVTGSKTIDMFFLGVVGIDEQTVSAKAVAGFGNLKIDAYMAIDATGSMGADPCNAPQNNDGCPIKEAKAAAQDFADILLGSGAAGIQVGIGPFRGCYNPPRRENNCVPPGSMVADLTNNDGLINGKISSIQAQGGTGTNICLGLLKGEEIMFGPNGQEGSDVRRYLILLSDGDNTYNNDAYGNGEPPTACRPTSTPQNSDQHVDSACRAAQTRERQLDTKTKALRDEMKALGVEIFVVGFGVCGNANAYSCDLGTIGSAAHDNTADRNLLKCLASSSAGTNDHYYEVETAEDLPAVFQTIAQQIAHRLIE